jgi:hypothetical protein
MNRPRRHHILPVFYLAGFTDTGTRNGRVCVFDYFRNTRYRANPNQVANEREFYRIYERGYDPYVVERNLAQFEKECAPVLYRVIETGIFNGAEELGAILSLVALLHARGRVARERLSISIQQTMTEKIKAGEVTREQWEMMVAAEIRAGVDPSTLPPFEELKGLVERGEWKPKAPEVLKVGLIPEMQQMIFDAIVDRTWSLARTTLTSGGFICSDTPLSWSDLPPWHPDASKSRLDDPNIVVTFPLSKDLALITRDDGRVGTYQAIDEVVAWVNSRTHLFSLGTLYSASEDFLLLREKNEIGHSSDYFSYVEHARNEGIENP